MSTNLLGLGIITTNGILLHEKVNRSSPEDHYIHNADDLALSIENMVTLVPIESMRNGELIAVYKVSGDAGDKLMATVWGIIDERAKIKAKELTQPKKTKGKKL